MLHYLNLRTKSLFCFYYTSRKLIVRYFIKCGRKCCCKKARHHQMTPYTWKRIAPYDLLSASFIIIAICNITISCAESVCWHVATCKLKSMVHNETLFSTFIRSLGLNYSSFLNLKKTHNKFGGELIWNSAREPLCKMSRF